MTAEEDETFLEEVVMGGPALATKCTLCRERAIAVLIDELTEVELHLCTDDYIARAKLKGFVKPDGSDPTKAADWAKIVESRRA